MAVTPTYPGVYVQEVPSGVRTIAGVSTSIGMFLGMTKAGPMSDPVRCTTYTDFVRAFSDDTSSAQLPNYVKLFFLNGGTDCYVMRLANGATNASVAIKNELGAEVLVLAAKNAGATGENIRAIVTYGGAQPEATFNLDLFQWVYDAKGNRTKTGVESWKGLSMDPASPLFAPTYLTQNSQLVTSTLGGAVPAAGKGFSLSGRGVDETVSFQAGWQPLLGNFAGVKTNKFQISVAGSPFVEVDLATITVTTAANLITDIQNAVSARFAVLGFPGVNVVVTFPAAGPANHFRLRIEPAAATGDVFIRPGSSNDLAVPLMLGSAQGGLEISGRADQRPAVSGITFRPTEAALDDFAALAQNGLANFTIDVMKPDGTFVADTVPMTGGVLPSIITTAAGDSMSKDANASSPNGNADGLREKLGIIAQRLSQFVPTVAGNKNKWKVNVTNYRLTLLPTDDIADNFISTNFAVSAATLTPHFSPPNVHLYTVGAGGNNIGEQTSALLPASDGSAPTAADYDNAYLVVDKQVDLFNLMVLPPDVPGKDMSGFYGNASVFCQQRSAVLLMDPPPTWVSASDASTKIAALRVGLVKDFAALFFPRITIVDSNGVNANIGPAGAIAGLCARIDGTRGVWKAPAGTEADLRGIIGVEHKFSDGEHGIMNPRAVNVIRVFPNGIVNFGARTMDGDDDFGSEYKYIPIRRLALYIEVSLYRGLKWVVFEPNDEPLWAQIRLNVGAFMHDLFRKGAFQGATPKDAYFVKCDGETTTQSDRNLGIVNIWVGFAPLKPAEFVILYLQQMAGQIQV
ncbi:MAG: phage tail sheath C-terminal domain-containing protein [Terriglobia bacterium]